MVPLKGQLWTQKAGGFEHYQERVLAAAPCEDSLQQHCRTEHAEMETVSNCAIQYGSHLWATEHWNVAREPEEQEFSI